MVSELEHKFCRKMYQSKVLDNIKTLDAFIKAVIAASHSQEDENEFKGNCFEVFDEMWLRTCTNNLAGIIPSEYHPANNIDPLLSRKDHGVDGYGKLHDGSDFTRQCKFKSNPTTLIDRNDDHVGNFFEDSVSKFNVTDKKKMTWATTGQGMATNCSDYKSITNIHVYKNSINDSIFWDNFRQAVLDHTNKHQQVVSTPNLMPHQTTALISIQAFLNNSVQRGKIYVPTGGGKTRIALEAIKELSNLKSQSISLLLVPRLNLISQHFNSMRDLGYGRLFNVQICSSDHSHFIVQDEFKDLNIKATTNKETIVKSLNGGKPSLIISTYHSAEDLLIHLLKANLKVDLVCCDEAHNLVYSGESESKWNQMLDPVTGLLGNASKLLFFTATAKITDSGEHGMTDKDYFGDILFQIEPRELMQAGVICKPKLLPVFCNLPDGGEVHNAKPEDILFTLNILKNKVLSETKWFKVVVTCDGIDQAKELCKAVNADTNFTDCKAWFQASDSDRYSDISGDRDQHLNAFKQAVSGIMFHYKTMGEGIDIPDINCVVTLRDMGVIEATQTIGRTLRLYRDDRESLKDNKISVGDPSGWIKPYGYIGIIYSGKDLISSETKNKFQDILTLFRQEGFDFEGNAEVVNFEVDPSAIKDTIEIRPAITPNISDPDNKLEFERLEKDLTEELNWAYSRVSLEDM